MMDFDWTIVVEIVLMVLACVLTGYLIPWVRGKIGAEKTEQLWHTVCTLVQAAEQLFGPGTGEKKKAYVETQLRGHGMSAPDAMIEAAVRELT